MKEVLDFKISTEARTLDEEKALLKKLGEVEAQLKEAIASQRLRKKAELVEQDIEQITQNINGLSLAIDQINKQISELRAKLEINKQKKEKPKRERQSAPAPLTISLQDIAVIKNKKKDNGTKANEQANGQAQA
ncbi:MAG: hypothetical protein ACP5T4_01585 [Candidatus Micrarchaeia archaeon]